MSAAGDGYGQPYGSQASPYPEQPAGDEPVSPPPHADSHSAPDHGKKKKRAYAAGAFDVGSGANAAVGGQVQGGGQFGAPQPPAQGYGGYPQPEPAGAPFGSQPAYGGGQPGAVGGYQAPDPYYPSGAAPSPAMVGGITSGISSMQLGPNPAAQQPPAPQAHPVRAGPLNQLYPTDLLNQPFNVSELDLPPPPIVLPPNVSFPHSPSS